MDIAICRDNLNHDIIKKGLIFMIHNKIYKQYYPLVSEEDKINLLASNANEIYKFVYNLNLELGHEYFERQNKYISKLKPTVSLLGTPKYGNILYNQYISQTMTLDKNIEDIKETLCNFDLLEYKLAYHDYENITVDELNQTLIYMNTKTHRKWFILLLFFIFIILGVILWK